MSTGQKVVLIDKIDVSPTAKQVNGPAVRASHWKYQHEAPTSESQERPKTHSWAPARGIGLS
ncbi:MAG: hypothetical protein ABGX22_23650 [Pirellulaceae bacterium]